MIDGLHTQQRPVAHGFHLLHFRMSDVEAMLKNLWLSKHLIIHPHAIHTFDVSQVSEPDEGDEPSAIGKGGHESAFCALTKF